MATLSQPFDTEDEEKKQGQGSNDPIPVGGSGQGAVIAAGGQGGQLAAGAPTSSGSFTNIQKYLNANKDQNLAGQISSNIGNQAKDTQSNLAGVRQAFDQQSQSVVQPITQNAGLLNQAVADPYGFSQNQQNVSNLSQARDASYTGPKSLADVGGTQNYNTVAAQSGNVTQQANQTQNEQGRFNLLRQMFNKPSYTQGQQSLDNLFLQGNQDQLKQLGQTRQVAAKTQNDVFQAQNAAAQQGQQYADQLSNIRNTVRGGLNNAVTGTQKEIQDQMANATQAQKDAMAQAQADAKLGKFDADTTKSLGAGTRLWDVNAGDYMSAPIAATLQQAATADQYNKLGGLKSLLGNTANEDSSKTLQTFNDPTQAGKYSKTPLIDTQRLLAAIQGRANDYKNNPLVQESQNKMADAQKALTGNMYVEGGLGNTLKGEANFLRSQLVADPKFNTNPALNDDIKNLSDTDLLNKYQAYDINSAINARTGIDKQNLTEQQKQQMIRDQLGFNLVGGINMQSPELGIDRTGTTGSQIGDLLAQYNFENQKNDYWRNALTKLEDTMGFKNKVQDSG